MANWYYVVGSERVGPVSVEALKQLFLDNTITTETYVWKKGFQNWERLKEVGELRFDNASEKAPEKTPAPMPKKEEVLEIFQTEAAPVDSSPEVYFSFDWETVKEQEELFFVKIGKDRKNYEGANIYGPYSLVELKEAFKEKRINLETLVFSPGMNSWTKIQETPVNEHDHLKSAGHIGLNEVPLVLVFDYSPLPLVTLIKKAGVNAGVLLGAGPFLEFKNKTVKASLYIGNEIKVKDVKVKIQSYDKKDQAIECQFVDLNQDAKKIMLNHGI